MLASFTLMHVVISLAGIVSGFAVIGGFMTRRRSDRVNAFFLITTVATSVTGFLFPVERFLPSHAVGILSLAVLTVAIVAWRHNLAGSWRTAYVITAIAAQYFNVFVLVVQIFAKTPALKALAPTQSEQPFVITQGIVFALFLIVGVAAVRRFRAEPALAT